MDTKTGIIGLMVLVLLTGGFVFWYISRHPAPSQTAPQGTTDTAALGQGAAANLDESAAYYDIQASYPSTTGLSASADAKAVAVMKKFEEDTIAQFKKDGNFDNLTPNDVEIIGIGERKMTLDITYVPKIGNRTLSYVYTITMDTFGAHPNTFFHTFTFNSSTGANLSLRDLFVPGADYLGTLSKLSRTLLPAVIAKSVGVEPADVDMTMVNGGTNAEAKNFENWYLENGNLVLIFQPYQVAAYAAGTQTLSIPVSQLGASLRTEYR